MQQGTEQSLAASYFSNDDVNRLNYTGDGLGRGAYNDVSPTSKYRSYKANRSCQAEPVPYAEHAKPIMNYVPNAALDLFEHASYADFKLPTAQPSINQIAEPSMMDFTLIDSGRPHPNDADGPACTIS